MRLRSEISTEDLIALGLTVGKNFSRQEKTLIDQSHCWLITIGDDVVIGVNAVVNKSIPSHCIVAGVPATIIKVRNSSNEKWSNLNVSHQSGVR